MSQINIPHRPHRELYPTTLIDVLRFIVCGAFVAFAFALGAWCLVQVQA